jgi:hypothetical protein
MIRFLLPAALAIALAAGAAVAAEVETMKSIMADHVNPGALAFWAGGNDPPEDETKAAANARWVEAVKGAQEMQAFGKMMMAAPYTRSGRWNAEAKLLVDTSRDGEAAAKARNAEKSFEIGARLYDACKGCHDAYVPRRE